MLRTMLKSKLHRALVTEANVDYEGSITIDAELMEAADILPYEMVHVLDVDNGTRLTTYAIEGERGSGVICANGAAARLVKRGDRVIILSYCEVSEEEARTLVPKQAHLGERNTIVNGRMLREVGL